MLSMRVYRVVEGAYSIVKGLGFGWRVLPGFYTGLKEVYLKVQV